MRWLIFRSLTRVFGRGSNMTPRTKSMRIVMIFLVFYGLSLEGLINDTVAETILGFFCLLIGCLFHDCIFPVSYTHLTLPTIYSV